MKSEFGNRPCFIFYTCNFSVFLLFSTFSFHRSFISVWPLSFFSPSCLIIFLFLSIHTWVHILHCFFFYYSSFNSPFITLTPFRLFSLRCFLFLHHGSFISSSLSVYVSISPNPALISPFIFFSLSLICLFFRSTTFALLALVQQCNKYVRKFMTPLIPNKVFRLCYVMIRCFLLWKRR